MHSSTLKIGALAQRTGTNAPTIRYYEQIGLLPTPSRINGSQRVYDDADIRRLAFIRRCREFGFSIEQVRTLSSLAQDHQRPCMEGRELAHGHLLAIREKLVELQELERVIAIFVARCDQFCATGPGADCVALEQLGQMNTAPKPGCCV